MNLLKQYQNGNALVSLYSDGTREVTTQDNEFKFEYPMNIDIRLSNYCPYGKNPNTGKAICSFCHESAVADKTQKGTDFNLLKQRLEELPETLGLELAVGINYFDKDNCTNTEFIRWAHSKGFIVNITVNSMNLSRIVIQRLRELITEGAIKGLGISYRPNTELPRTILDYPNTVVHVIAGIDDVLDVHKLHLQGVKKILILGEKDFGFNKGKLILGSQSHQDWKRLLPKLLEKFEVVSFDNLALEQLQVKTLLESMNHTALDDWDTFYQGEHSFYINAVDNYFAPSSRSDTDLVSLSDCSIKDYFKFISDKGLTFNQLVA